MRDFYAIRVGFEFFSKTKIFEGNFIIIVNDDVLRVEWEIGDLEFRNDQHSLNDLLHDLQLYDKRRDTCIEVNIFLHEVIQSLSLEVIKDDVEVIFTSE